MKRGDIVLVVPKPTFIGEWQFRHFSTPPARDVSPGIPPRHHLGTYVDTRSAKLNRMCLLHWGAPKSRLWLQVLVLLSALVRHSGELHGMVSSTIDHLNFRLVMATMSGRAVVTRISFGMRGGNGGFLCSEAREVSQHLSFWQSWLDAIDLQES